MITLEEKYQCCGCAACVQRCPKHCISTKEDEEGFLYPHVDTAACIDCGLCEKVCPVINQSEPKEPLKVYAAKNTDLQKRELSSSGGLFIALAEKVIERGGVVFGVVFDENWEAHHVSATTLEEVEPMMRSKYMQSRVENTFAEAERFLKEGREVMYTGTPCQIAGLKKFLRREYENLLAVDIVCHGVPSVKVWREYLSVIGKRLNFVNFRAKQDDGFSWRSYGLVINDCTGSIAVKEKASENIFLRGFSQNLYLRPSCHKCPAKSGKSQSDLTLGDYWGIWNDRQEFDDNKGVSLVLVNSQKGKEIFDDLQLEVMESDFRYAVTGNPMLAFSAPEEIEVRKEFWKRHEVDGINCIHEILEDLKPSMIKRILSIIKRIFVKCELVF